MTITSKPATAEYLRGWDLAFGPKEAAPEQPPYVRMTRTFTMDQPPEERGPWKAEESLDGGATWKEKAPAVQASEGGTANG